MEHIKKLVSEFIKGEFTLSVYTKETMNEEFKQACASINKTVEDVISSIPNKIQSRALASRYIPYVNCIRLSFQGKNMFLSNDLVDLDLSVSSPIKNALFAKFIIAKALLSQQNAFHVKSQISLSAEEKLMCDYAVLRYENYLLSNKHQTLKNNVINVFGQQLKGVQTETKFVNLQKQSDKIIEQKKKVEQKQIEIMERAKLDAANRQKVKDFDYLEKNNPICISDNPTERINDCGTPFTSNTYNGCGNYWVAVKNGLIVASVKMEQCLITMSFENYREWCKLKLAQYGDVFTGEGSGTQFFCKRVEDLKHFNNSKIYDVPSAKGGLHTNLQAI